LKKVVKDQKRVFVLEDHSAIGGLGDRLVKCLVEIREISGKEFTNFGLREYPECGTPLEVLEFHQLDGKSLAKRISGVDDIESEEKLNRNYTADAPQ
jgi:transketolase